MQLLDIKKPKLYKYKSMCVYLVHKKDQAAFGSKVSMLRCWQWKHANLFFEESWCIYVVIYIHICIYIAKGPTCP